MYNVDHFLSIPIYGHMGHYKFSYENDFYKVCHINIFMYEHICLYSLWNNTQEGNYCVTN